MGNDLNSAAQILTTALAAQNSFVHLASGKIIIARHARIEKTLVVTQIEIGFCTILSDKNLTVLKGTHGTRVNVEIRIELEQGDF